MFDFCLIIVYYVYSGNYRDYRMSVFSIRLAEDGPFPVNEKLAGVVPMALPFEQTALTVDIDTNGQMEPVVLWQGAVVDGRCRQQALTALGKDIIYRELDPEMTEEEVKVFVKAVNTRRNLTASQKVAVACKQYFEDKGNLTISQVAKSWGVGEMTLKNALWIYKQDPAVIETIFDGGTVAITDRQGKPIQSNKVTSIYAFMRKKAETVVVHDKGWQPGSFIKTQAGKDWYYEQLGYIGESTPHVRLLVAELANFKFESVDQV